MTCSLSDNGTKLTINGDTETSQETYGGNNICPSSLDYSSLQTIEFGKGIAVIDKPSSDWFMLSSAKSLYAPYVREIKDDAFHYSSFEYIDLPNVETVEIGALGASISNHSITYVNIPSSVYIPYDTSGSGDQIDEETLFYEAFGLYPSSCSQEDGVTTCGNCGDKFVKEGRGCVTDCGEGYTADSTSGRCNKNTSGSQVSASDCYASGQVFYQDACVDEYPFAKKHWTPAEANQWLYDENNMVIMTFKVNR